MKNRQRVIFFSICAVLTVVLALFVAYQKLPSTFFQQDEWQYFGLNIYAHESGTTLKNLLLPQQGTLTHFFPLATLFFYMEYVFFGMNVPSYIYLNLVIHMVNVALLFFLVKKITNNSLSAYFSAILFSVYSLVHQPLTWVAAGIGTLPSTLFLLLSLIVFQSFLSKKGTRTIFLCVLLILISILFKEVSLFLLGFFPIVGLISGKKSSASTRQLIIPIGLVLLIYLGLRIVFLAGALQSQMPEIGDVSVASPGTYLIRLFTLPLKAVTQSIVPVTWLLTISDSVVRVAYPHFIGIDGSVNPYVSQSIVFDLVGYYLSFGILLAVFVVYGMLLKYKKKQLAMSLVWATSFIILSALPYIFIPGKAGYFSIFEPRNLYVISIGTTVLIALFFTLPFVVSRNLFIHVAFGVLFASIIVFHMIGIRSHIAALVGVGSIRKRLLDIIVNQYPKLPAKVLFFTESDSSYYGLPAEEKTLPVQSGFGRMLMVWYQNKEHFPACLYAQQFLHDLISQGYRECEGRGFGYFRQYSSLVSALREHNLPPQAVIAYGWQGKPEQFTNITEQIRKLVFDQIQL